MTEIIILVSIIMGLNTAVKVDKNNINKSLHNFSKILSRGTISNLISSIVTNNIIRFDTNHEKYSWY